MTAKEYNRIVDRWSDDLYRFALRLCSDREPSRDIVQEAFAALWSQRERVGEKQGKSFLFTVAYRRAQDLFRRLYRERELEPEEETTCHLDEGFDLKAAMELALSALPQVQRAVLELHEVQGYNHEEISNILTISEQQARTYLFRARVALQRKLTEYGYHQ